MRDVLCRVPKSAQPSGATLARTIFAQPGAASSTFPTAHWRQIWSNDPQERPNREIRRRSDMAGLFPDREGIVRLVGSVFSGQHDEWQAGRRSMPIESIEKAMQPAPP